MGSDPFPVFFTSQIPLRTTTLNYFQFPSFALSCPTARTSLKSGNPYNWPVLSTCPNPQPVKILPFTISDATSFRKLSLISFLRNSSLLKLFICRNLDSISSYYKGLPILHLSMAGLNLILRCRSVHEITHLLNCNELLSFLHPSSSSAGMFKCFKHGTTSMVEGPPGRVNVSTNPLKRFLRSGALDYSLPHLGLGTASCSGNQSHSFPLPGRGNSPDCPRTPDFTLLSEGVSTLHFLPSKHCHPPQAPSSSLFFHNRFLWPNNSKFNH